MFKRKNNKDVNSIFLNIISNSKAWITKVAHHNVSLRSGKDLSLETHKLLMSHCLAERWGGDADVIHKDFFVHPAFFHPYYSLFSHLHYKFWKKNK